MLKQIKSFDRKMLQNTSLKFRFGGQKIFWETTALQPPLSFATGCASWLTNSEVANS